MRFIKFACGRMLWIKQWVSHAYPLCVYCLLAIKWCKYTHCPAFKWYFFINTKSKEALPRSSRQEAPSTVAVATVEVTCPPPGCGFKTEDQETSIVAAILQKQIHASAHTTAVGGGTQVIEPKLDRPRIDTGADQEAWNTFLRRWEAFRVGSGVSDSMAFVQLLQCASEEPSERLLEAIPQIEACPLDESSVRSHGDALALRKHQTRRSGSSSALHRRNVAPVRNVPRGDALASVRELDEQKRRHAQTRRSS